MVYSFAERTFYQASFLLLALVPLVLVAGQLDSRLLHDIPIWLKPQKFNISTAIHLLTFALLIQFLPRKTRHALWLSIVAGVAALATIFEVILINFQAARGVQSHFNFSSHFDGMIYALMGVAALLLTAPALILGVRFLFASTSKVLTPGLRIGAGLGLTVGCILTVAIAGYMSMQPTGHWVEAPQTDIGGLPIVGWTRQGGDLRVPHFFATHLMQVLPLLGFVLGQIPKRQG